MTELQIKNAILKLTAELHGSTEFYEVMVEAMMMHSRKARDYTASTNDPFRNFKAAALWADCTPLQAVRMHQGSKIDRISNLIALGDDEANFESLLDSKRDLLVYLAIEQAMLKSTDPG